MKLENKVKLELLKGRKGVLWKDNLLLIFRKAKLRVQTLLLKCGDVLMGVLGHDASQYVRNSKKAGTSAGDLACCWA